jgi:SNF2 family DNA or RNA helicase
MPEASPELVLEDRLAEAATRLSPWQVGSLSFGPAGGVDLLLSLPPEPPRGLAFGASARFWAEAAKLSLALVARRSFVPRLKGAGPGAGESHRAVWEAVLSGADAERAEALAAAMPPACRLVLPTDGAPPPRARDLVMDFLDRAVDAIVRAAVPPGVLLQARRGRRVAAASAAEAWVSGLAGGSGALPSSVAGFDAFRGSLEGWLGEAAPSDPRAPFRTCFRLEPPAVEDAAGGAGPAGGGRGGAAGAWHLGFHLQARDDPSLLVGACDVWEGGSAHRAFLGRRFEDPQERLLADLGRASRLCPQVARGLEDARPDGVALDTRAAYDFLRNHAPLLAQAGFGVLVPPWWGSVAARPTARLVVRPRGTSQAASGLFGEGSIVDYDWRVAIGDEDITREEFEALARMKVPLVRLRGRWVELDPAEVDRLIAHLKARDGGGDGGMELGEALRLGLGLGRTQGGLEVTGIEGEGWVGDLLRELRGQARPAEVGTPRDLNGQLRPYQERGLSWLAFLDRYGLGACLADDMGLGKTVELIALLLHEREGAGREGAGRAGGGREGAGRAGRRGRTGPTLVVCPMSVAGNWRRELERFAPSLRVMVHHGQDRLGGGELARAAGGVDVVVTTYALAARDEEALSRVRWRRVVLDEAQNIKNPGTRQSRAVRRLKAGSRVALTGTPVENRLSELWSIMDFLNPGYLGTAPDFRRTFALPVERYRDPGRAAELRRLVQPFVLRRLKTDTSIIQDLPDKVEMKVYCNLTQEQGTLYQAVVDEMMERVSAADGIKRRGLVLAALTRLKQVCNHPAQLLHDGSAIEGRSGKLARLEEMLEEALAEGDRALVFTQYAEMGGMLRTRLQEALGQEVLYLHGGTTRSQREAMVERFQDPRGGPPVLVLSLKAGGLGLNLTAANRVVHYDRWWNPAVEEQATDRAFRIGQRRDVLVHKFVTAGTLEERIDALIERKRGLAEVVVGTGEDWLTELSTDQLRELISLGREAVGGE